MRKFFLILAVALLTLGCTTPTVASKQVVVTKDAEGRITQIIVTEQITQPNLAAKPIVFQHMGE